MISFDLDIFFRIFDDFVADLKIKNLKFVIRAKPELPALVQSIRQNYKLAYMQAGIHAISQDHRQEHNLIKKL